MNFDNLHFFSLQLEMREIDPQDEQQVFSWFDFNTI